MPIPLSKLRFHDFGIGDAGFVQFHNSPSVSPNIVIPPVDIISRMTSKFFYAGIAPAFVLTVVGARLFSWIFPRVHWEPEPGLHIHHYVYGIFLLTAAGYLALLFKGPRATTW